jgi:hypothetical protein
MAPRIRRSLPDNLDPLVDTLSNVVGILVIVVALTQIQMGDALARVAELDLLRLRGERVLETVPTVVGELEARRDALIRRTDVGVEEAIELARKTLEALATLPVADGTTAETRSLEDLSEDLKSSLRELEEKRTARKRREGYAGRLERAPKQMVARLPDPVVVQGKESWIFVRYGRIYLADREKLYEQGSRAIDRVLDTANQRRFRPDEFEAVALYLRKREIGFGNFRWILRTEPDIRVELAWRSTDDGLDYFDLENNAQLRSWLAARSPDVDFIRFQVWGDSFEAYLATREVVEAAGFRAGWRGRELDEELILSLSFGPAPPPIGPIVVD